MLTKFYLKNHVHFFHTFDASFFNFDCHVPINPIINRYENYTGTLIRHEKFSFSI